MTEPRERAYLALIERYSASIPDEVSRLKFVSLSARMFGGTRPFLRRNDPLWSLRSRAVALESLWLASGRHVRGIHAADATLLWFYLHRRLILKSLSATAVCLLLAQLPGSLRRHAAPGRAVFTAAAAAPVPPIRMGRDDIWVVETSSTSELYSNGLRILNDFVTHSGPRVYGVTRVGDPASIDWRHQPAGIVYHTTESEMAALEPENRDLIRRRGEGLLDYVRRARLYNFVIDRFGRIYRVVPETEYANHAGHSVWASGSDVFIGLNQSFIGIAFEARGKTGAPQGGPEEDAITAAQLYSGRILTETLMSRYGIPETNCVGHDLVSVNPASMLIGYHTDWAGAFPFAALGLADKYSQIIPSIVLFGFGHDAAFLSAVEGRLWPGIPASEAEIERQARLLALHPDRYRRQLQQDFRRRAAMLRAAAPPR